jgi:hypothetical protein
MPDSSHTSHRPMLHVVHAMTRPALRAVLAAFAVFAVAITPAVADDDDGDPDGTTVSYARATAVTATTANLTAFIASNSSWTTYRAEYAPAANLSQVIRTPLVALGAQGWKTVSVAGLTPATAYRFRLVAYNRAGNFVGDSQAGFTTAAATPVAAPPVAPAPVAAPAPDLGQSAVVAPVEGTVEVKVPGAAAYTPLAAGSEVPVGTIVDTRGGTVRLTSATSTGGTQSGQFGDGLFQVKQSRTGKGVTDIVLRGGNFSSCGGRGSARAAAAKAKPKRRLWARDRGGRFRTHGRNSVATVRGTRWVTTDTCAGTRTTVTEGSVAVRDLRRKKTVVVRKGKSYLARGRR